jgi:hypothetical protein
MKSKILLITLLILGSSMVFTSCVYEETVVITGNPRVAIDFDYWTGARHVEIDGSVFNNGNLNVRSVNIEFILLDEFGDMISSSWHRYRVDIHPGQEFFFVIDIGEYYVYDVHLGRVEADGY